VWAEIVHHCVHNCKSTDVLRPLAYGLRFRLNFEYIEEASEARVSPVAKAIRSEHAKAKDATKLADDGSPLHS